MTTTSAAAHLPSPAYASGWQRWPVGLLLLTVGLGLVAPGAYLARLGGSPYYLVAGLLISLSAVLILRRHPAGAWLYALVLLGSVAWSLWEVGLDGWALMPRLVFLAVAGLFLLLPGVCSRAPETPRPRAGLLRFGFGLAAAALAVALVVALVVAPKTTSARSFARPWSGGSRTAANIPAAGEWTQYGGTAHGSRYSPLAQITPTNAANLQVAWTFRSGQQAPGGKRRGGLQATPLMIEGTLYGCTAFDSVFALDPLTGRQLWRTDARIHEDDGGHPVCRGMAFFRAPQGVTECPTRLLLGTIANRLIALDARTGARCKSFGVDGEVDLLQGMGDFPHRWSHPTSPPTIVNGTAVIGAYVVDNQSTQAPPGVVRGYDAVTGELKWAFDPGQPNVQAPPTPPQTYTPSTPNSWSVASADEALGLIYLPMGNGSPDFVGVQRSPATDRFSTSLVALDARTGAVRWTFQAVHHDLWDYDLAAQPVLVDFPTAGGATAAVILATKTGQIFVLDRRTGRPLTRVEERQVPASTIPGERASPTQPFSTGMPDFAGEPLRERNMWGVTPFDQLYCRIRFRQAAYEGMYTPPRLGPTIRYPGELGGIDWGSVSVDEGRAILIVNSNHMADLDELIPRAQAEREGLAPRLNAQAHQTPGAAMAGTPYAIHWGAFLSGLKVPCQQPPYGFLTAVDLRTRQVIWRRPLGDARNSGPFGKGLGLPLPLGAPNIGGAVSTGGGVVFIAATQDEMFRAIDVRTGKVVWQTQLPAGGHATPMTYLGRDRRQYVLIAAGGGSLKDKPGDYFIAFRLKPAP
jgi:quinoprotein glucose dehydrogenase